MSKLIFQFTFILFFVSNIAFSEEVILTIQGRHQENVILIDSILVENLTNQTSIWMTNLPNRYLQDFNLTTGTITGVNEFFDIKNDKNYIQALENNVGTMKFQLFAQSTSDTEVLIYNLNGQKIYQSSFNTTAGINHIEVSIGFSGLSIVQLIHNNKSKSTKVYGNPLHSTKVSVIPVNKIENKSGTTSQNDDFSFSLNDEIQITAFAKDIKSESVKKIVSESQEFICDFIDSDTCGLFVDTRDTAAYKWVKIGDQIWMAENLNFNAVGNCWIQENPIEVTRFGRYYSWETAETSCPSGWHIPTNDEWNLLAEFISQSKGPFEKNEEGWLNVALYLKATYGWDENCGTDEYGFAAFPGGTATNAGFFLKNFSGHWWTATEMNENEAQSRYIDEASNYKLGLTHTGKTIGLNVRCVKNN